MYNTPIPKHLKLDLYLMRINLICLQNQMTATWAMQILRILHEYTSDFLISLKVFLINLVELLSRQHLVPGLPHKVSKNE